MDGLDHAAPIDALRRRLRRIRPPRASIAFRDQAWRDFEHALDPLGVPALSPTRSQGVSATVRVHQLRSVVKGVIPERVRGFETWGRKLAFRLLIVISRNANRVLTPHRRGTRAERRGLQVRVLLGASAASAEHLNANWFRRPVPVEPPALERVLRDFQPGGPNPSLRPRSAQS